MVWGVCRRLLNHHDAEDAFQATFLVLVRKAADVPREAVANWLYGVARQTAVRLRATAAKRGRRETQVVNMPEPTVPEVRDADLQRVVDDELSRLPVHYRGVIVLCDLEGMTRREAARQLGIPEGGVASRLARARALLAKRFVQRGVVFSGGSVAAVLSAGSASASAPPALVASTIKAASLLAAGQAAGVVTAKVAALTEGVVKAMFVSKIKATLSVVLILCCVATGVTLLTYHTAAGQDKQKPTAEKPVEPAKQRAAEKPVEPAKQQKEKEPFTAWGKEVGGLQAGLGYLPGQCRTYATGETVKLVVRVRNVSKEAVTFQHVPQFLRSISPAVTDSEGRQVDFDSSITTVGKFWPQRVDLATGKEIEICELEIKIRPASESGNEAHSALYGAGKFQIQYMRVDFPDNDLGKLVTGKLEFAIKEVAKGKDDGR